MDAQHVLNASALDIIFEGRNKEYGAYILRKEYNKRLLVSLALTSLLTALAVVIAYSHHDTAMVAVRQVTIPDKQLVALPKNEEVPPPKPVPPRAPAAPAVRIIRNTVPVIVKDPPPQEMPPDNQLLETSKIGLITQEGPSDNGIIPPPGSFNGVTANNNASEEAPAFIPIEIEAEFPGGIAAWRRFLNRTLTYPQEAQQKEVQGTVIVQFFVDTDGNVSEVQALSGPAELRDEAVREIKKSGKWSPASQNGKKVKSYKKQPVSFQLVE